ncbi:hypothetical protein [Cumulibacter soli]|uniref:hypothetical protein n=1 Tax=Cumulibacter soli TaxID=2546344 RepID=UPI001068AED9|nr:hypothetical protein [Cumulibacter soli]
MTLPDPEHPDPPGAPAVQLDAAARTAATQSADRGRRAQFGIAIGVLAAFVGLLPQLFNGARLPLQNLWTTDSAAMPFALLPLNQYYILQVLIMQLVGGLVAGVAARALQHRVPRLAASLGVLGIHLVATLQVAVVLADGLGIATSYADDRALLYFFGMLGIALLGTGLGQAIFWLTQSKSVPICAVGLLASAVPIASWINYVVVVFTGVGEGMSTWNSVTHWLPAVIVGLVLAWCGVRPLARIAVWVAGLVILWLVPPLFIAIPYSLGTRWVGTDISDALASGVDVFGAALWQDGRPLLVALVIAIAGTIVFTLVNHTRHGRIPTTGHIDY